MSRGARDLVRARAAIVEGARHIMRGARDLVRERAALVYGPRDVTVPRDLVRARTAIADDITRGARDLAQGALGAPA